METNPNVIFRKAWLVAVESGAFDETDEPAFYFGAMNALRAALQGNEKREDSLVLRNRIRLLEDEIYRHITVSLEKACGCPSCRALQVARELVSKAVNPDGV